MRTLRAKKIPYSSVVGGGLMLTDESGRGFILNIVGTTEGVERSESDDISAALEHLINIGGIEIRHRK